jgi:hypothetical protein
MERADNPSHPPGCLHRVRRFANDRRAHYTGKVGAWLSLVERLVRDQEAGGSNPLAPTIASVQLGAVRTGWLYANNGGRPRPLTDLTNT